MQASNEEIENEVLVQKDLEDIALQLKIWTSLVDSVEPVPPQEWSAYNLFTQCITIGTIFEKMPRWQLRLLALQLAGSSLPVVSKENKKYIKSLEYLSMDWRALFVRLNRWHARLQTVFLKADGFRKHCKAFERDLLKFGDDVFEIQNRQCKHDYAIEASTLQRAFEQLYCLLNRMKHYTISLNAMKYGPISEFRRRQLQECEKLLSDLDEFLNLEKDRFMLITGNFGQVSESCSNFKIKFYLIIAS